MRKRQCVRSVESQLNEFSDIFGDGLSVTVHWTFVPGIGVASSQVTFGTLRHEADIGGLIRFRDPWHAIFLQHSAKFSWEPEIG
jgi:hypothetical protein